MAAMRILIGLGLADLASSFRDCGRTKSSECESGKASSKG
jgi:hypothetical protein